MCGIFCVINDKKNNAATTVLKGLKKLEYRGYDSWGIALKNENHTSLLIDKHVGKIEHAKTNLPQGSLAIGHTRWATHGGVTNENAHPHLDCSQTISVVHNGIVENHQELKYSLLKKGHRFSSETDTEVIAHLIEEKQKKMNMKEAVFQSFLELAGSNAIAVLDYSSDVILACRNGSPLVVGFGKNEYYVASDVTAFLDKANQVYYLLDNEAAILSKHKVSVYSLISHKLKRFFTQQITWKNLEAKKGKYPHFLLKEIMEQKESIPRALLLKNKVKKQLNTYINHGYQTVFIGCGTASYCGIAATYLFANNHLFSRAIGAYEIYPFIPLINKKSLIIAVSQSGETADTLYAVKEAKKKGGCIAALVNTQGSTLERISDLVLPVNAGPEIAVVSTKAFTTQLAHLFSLFSQKKDVKLISQSLNKWLNQRLLRQVLALAKKFQDIAHTFVIGKYINYAGALEFALKLKETSYIHAEAFSAGELKHGVIALVQKGTPCFVLAGSQSTHTEICSSAAELKARGAHIIGISPFSSNIFDDWIQTPDVGESYSIFFNVIVGQLLGYYLGIGRGADPDKPRNLAKSVTVK